MRVSFNFSPAASPDPLKQARQPLKSACIYKYTMAKSTISLAPALPASYEAALQELEGLIASLESGQLPLDQLLAGYQRGAQLLAFCKDKLESVENQIKVLEGNELKAWP